MTLAIASRRFRRVWPVGAQRIQAPKMEAFTDGTVRCYGDCRYRSWLSLLPRRL